MTVTDLYPAAAEASQPEPTLAEIDAWVTDWFSQILERRASNRRRWCRSWWDHPEALTRLRVLMLSHRDVVRRGSAIDQSAWMLDHLDRHLDALQDPDGPFAACSPDRHTPHLGLTVEPMKGRIR